MYGDPYPCLPVPMGMLQPGSLVVPHLLLLSPSTTEVTLLVVIGSRSCIHLYLSRLALQHYIKVLLTFVLHVILQILYDGLWFHVGHYIFKNGNMVLCCNPLVGRHFLTRCCM